jgi:hypothetical protein
MKLFDMVVLIPRKLVLDSLDIGDVSKMGNELV